MGTMRKKDQEMAKKAPGESQVFVRRLVIIAVIRMVNTGNITIPN